MLLRSSMPAEASPAVSGQGFLWPCVPKATRPGPTQRPSPRLVCVPVSSAGRPTQHAVEPARDWTGSVRVWTCAPPPRRVCGGGWPQEELNAPASKRAARWPTAQWASAGLLKQRRQPWPDGALPASMPSCQSSPRRVPPAGLPRGFPAGPGRPAAASGRLSLGQAPWPPVARRPIAFAGPGRRRSVRTHGAPDDGRGAWILSGDRRGFAGGIYPPSFGPGWVCG